MEFYELTLDFLLCWQGHFNSYQYFRVLLQHEPFFLLI